MRKNCKFVFPMATENDITKKNYTKLTLKAAQYGFSFCVTNTLNQQVIAIKEVLFPEGSQENVATLYSNAFETHPELTNPHDDYLVMHENNLNTFVPKPLFDEDYAGSYLQYNTQVFETDYFSFDELTEYDLCNVFIPYVNINNFLFDQFGSFHYKSATSILVKRLLDLSRNNNEPQVYAYFSKQHFTLVIVKNQQLLLCNTYAYKATEDFLYFLLFATEQLALNPESFKLNLLGYITQNDPYFNMAYKYVRHVEMLDLIPFMPNNGLTAAENRQHFLLLQA
jgi:hypothetical protein